MVPGEICLHVGDPADIAERVHSGQGMTVFYRGREVATVNSNDQVHLR
jgi:hypothetical protein